MTDLEITRLCGKAMELELVQRNARRSSGYWSHTLLKHYDPLHDDAQAMALVKKFHPYIDGLLMDDWTVALTSGAFSYEVINKDLNRAICECVAKMQQAKP